jgi:phosphoribosyl-AMP cyclohydrolase / phosphoribosyl-ATP pyrophosphohydrolase
MVFKLSENEIEEFVKKVDFNKTNGLIPAIVQDASNNQVLMHGYINEKALRLTLKTGKIHFWSRSRGRLWLKGEESGHTSLVQNAILDCDNDTLLFKVQQIGSICHTGKETCFHNFIVTEEKSKVDARVMERIFEVIQSRIKEPTENSYVSTLTLKGDNIILRKIEEETAELADSMKNNNSEEIVNEATDIIFHTMILLAKKDINIQDIFEELEKRHKEKTEYTYSHS